MCRAAVLSCQFYFRNWGEITSGHNMPRLGFSTAPSCYPSLIGCKEPTLPHSQWNKWCWELDYNVFCHITAAVAENSLELGDFQQLIVARSAHTKCLLSFLSQGTTFQQERAAGGAHFSPSHCQINRSMQWVLGVAGRSR